MWRMQIRGGVHAPLMKLKSPYPKHLHNTHLIPPIQDRERGVEPKPFAELRRSPEELGAPKYK